VVGACAAAAVLAWSVSAPAGTPSDEGSVPEGVRLLDVPFVPQSEALCGGAALAMVLRYWGKPGVLAEDFAALVEPGSGGIRSSALVRAVEALGWSAFSVSGTPAEVESHLAQGRPIIALIRVGSDSFHFVVLVAWANGWVAVHDPSVGPFRVIREEEFVVAWSGSNSWALLVLPPAETDGEGARDPAAITSSSSSVPDACSAMVETGILSAQAGDTAQAELRFLAAQSLCPASAAPFRERAGLRFRAEDWAGASRLAERALALDPGDTHSRRLLAGSRFLLGDVEGALHAWNHLSEPRADLTRIDGLARIRYSSVACQLDLPPGRLLTPQAFRQARRRLAEVPAQLESRLSLKPMPEGTAQVGVTLLERPPVFGGPWNVASAGIRAFTEQELALDVASPTGNGELWAAAWRWQSNRPRVSLVLTTPAAGVRPGIWRVDSYWERQTYAARFLSDTSGLNRPEPYREERRHSGLSFSDWIAPDIRLEIGAALDRWVDRGSHVSLEGSVETRWARDRLALSAQLARWLSLAGGAPFGTGGVSLTWSSSGLEKRDAWQGRLGFSGTTSDAPLALWSGAGTGYGRGPFLRAHPLLQGGVVEGRVFGRSLAHGTIERQAWPWRLGPLQFGWALFLDGAKPWEMGNAGSVPWQVDAGAGLRLRGLGTRGQFRLDAARGFEDGNSAVSIAWQIP
jgi:hypothetical protein